MDRCCHPGRHYCPRRPVVSVCVCVCACRILILPSLRLIISPANPHRISSREFNQLSSIRYFPPSQHTYILKLPTEHRAQPVLRACCFRLRGAAAQHGTARWTTAGCPHRTGPTARTRWRDVLCMLFYVKCFGAHGLLMGAGE